MRFDHRLISLVSHTQSCRRRSSLIFPPLDPAPFQERYDTIVSGALIIPLEGLAPNGGVNVHPFSAVVRPLSRFGTPCTARDFQGPRHSAPFRDCAIYRCRG